MRRIFIVLFVFLSTVICLGNSIIEKDTTIMVDSKDFNIEIVQRNDEYIVRVNEKHKRLYSVSNPFEGQVAELHEACMEAFIPTVQNFFPIICGYINIGDLYGVKLLVRCDDQHNLFKGCQFVARSKSLDKIYFFVKEITEGNRLMDAINKAAESVYRRISFIPREELAEDKRKKLEDEKSDYYWNIMIAINKDKLSLYGNYEYAE